MTIIEIIQVSYSAKNAQKGTLESRKHEFFSEHEILEKAKCYQNHVQLSDAQFISHKNRALIGQKSLRGCV